MSELDEEGMLLDHISWSRYPLDSAILADVRASEMFEGLPALTKNDILSGSPSMNFAKIS